jgi:glucan biosynthesis protein
MNGQVRFGARSAAILGALCALLAWQPALAFNFEDVAQRARQLAAASFKSQESKLPSEIEKLTYDEFRDIRFKPARSLWRAARRSGRQQAGAFRVTERTGAIDRAAEDRSVERSARAVTAAP